MKILQLNSMDTIDHADDQMKSKVGLGAGVWGKEERWVAQKLVLIDSRYCRRKDVR